MAAFIEGPVMTVLAARDDALRPSIGRGIGTRCLAGGTLADTLVPRALWPAVTANLHPGWPLALTFVDAASYQSFQVKAQIEALAPADAADLDLARRYRALVMAKLTALGVTNEQMAWWLSERDLMRVRYRPLDLYRQTPGPGAGSRIVAGGAPVAGGTP
ncbi:hypothetical protein DKG75_17925 [Zavarzinia compransoris]|uniref:Uncharacterized protein n=2 Tax=Zavarzinia compransoris TaxID=1264899 RepID=A0A317E0H0_9PROT|nr:hypothetical protein DKG75_17925 [Zavarzinia compransoris]